MKIPPEIKISPEVKSSLSIANSNVVDEQTYKKVLECCFAQLTKDTEGPTISEVQSSKPDVIKEVYAAFASLITEFARHDFNKERVAQFLASECNYSPGRVDIFSELYYENRIKLQIFLGDIGTYLPHVTDLKWKIDYMVKTNNLDDDEGVFFRLSFFVERYDVEEKCNKSERISFSCDNDELLDMMFKLKDATKHCQKIGAGHKG